MAETFGMEIYASNKLFFTLGQSNETCERFLHRISAEAVDKEEELCLFSREQR